MNTLASLRTCRARAVALTIAACLVAGLAWGEDPALRIVARDPAGHGVLCTSQGKTVLIVEGTPAQMGAAQGRLLGKQARKLMEKIYLVGGAYSIKKDDWFFTRMAEVMERAGPHVPERFLVECDAMSEAAGVSVRDGRIGNLFPEMFHCSGVAVRGKASKNGQVLHARVLDYMRDIGLQDVAVVTVFIPEGYNAWMSLGYAGFIGTVTAMNEKGVAIGEMGGGGQGDWDGVPMGFLLRDVMERADNTQEAIDILRESPRTCVYYYVVSDKSGNIAGLDCTPEEMLVLEPGQQHPRLPLVPEDVVLISGEDRAKLLSQRIQEHYGEIDAQTMIEIIKRPVSMRSNLHDAVFAPATLQMWCADAGKHTPACDEPYALFNLGEILRWYRADAEAQQAKPTAAARP